MKTFLPFALPLIGEDEINEVVDTLRSGWLTTGPKTKQFEKEFAEFVKVDFALAVNSATAGLHLALEAVGIKRGDKVITTPYTFTASAEVIRYFDADPLFVDIDLKTFNIDAEKIEQAILENPGQVKAILPVHFAGQACDMDKIMSISKEHNIPVIEDAAHALPTSYKNKLIGSVGDITVFSFYVTKTLATGEGGMITTNNSKFAERIRTMRLHGISRDVYDRYTSNKPSWYYEVIAPGFKYNMTDIAASLGIHQLRKANEMRVRRESIAEQYTKAFKNLPFKTPASPDLGLHSWHLYVIQLEQSKLKIDRNRFIELMSEEGIGTSVHFIPLHIQPFWRDMYALKPEDYPLSLEAYQNAVSLPIYPKMKDADIENVIKAVQKVCLEQKIN